MYGFDSLSINENGNLEISGCDCIMLAKKYGTPLYVMDEYDIRKRCREIKKAHIDKYNGMAVYASKAFQNKEMCRIINSEGLGLDVVSGGELFTAYSSGFPMEKVIFHGNNKSYEELEMAVDLNVGRIVIDNYLEIELLSKILHRENKKIDVMIRVAPGVHAHTHKYICTGQEDSKFGFPLRDGSAIKAVSLILNENKIFKLKGIHSHIGSQISSSEGYIKEINVLASFYNDILAKFSYEMDEINVGGGFGIYYVNSDQRRDISYYTDTINKCIDDEFKKIGLHRPRVIIEPGRWIVGEAGITLYKAGAEKDIEGIRKYISVDGGMADNIRPALYGAQYTAVVANKMKENNFEEVTIAGKSCESGDVLIKDIKLPIIEYGDIIAVLSTGAYCYSMSSNYNRLPRPAVVMVNKGKDRIVVNRETYENLIQYDI